MRVGTAVHPALFKLLALSTTSVFRRMFRGARSIRGAFLLLFTIGFLVLMIGPSLGVAFMRGRPGAPVMSGYVDPYLPLILFGLCLLFVFTAAGERALYFTPAEVDFLFPAPFNRRELLIYKLSKTMLGVLLMALVFSTSFLIYLPSWSSAFVGVFLSLTFVEFLAMATSFVGQIVAEHAFTARRRLILVCIGALVAMGLAQVLWQTPVQSFAGIAERFRESWTGRILLAPLEVFSHAILARTWFPDLLCWSAAAAAIDLALLALILKLDADYLESAAAISQKVYDKLQRMRQGGGFALPASQKAARIHVPPFPWLGGCGPQAWRQLLLAIRKSKYALLLISLFACGLLGVAFFGPNDAQGVPVISIVGLAFLGYLTFLLTLQVPWAFRGDIDHMDCLKSLPVAPLALAIGELAGGVMILAAIQFLVLAGLLLARGDFAVTMVGFGFLLLFDVLMLALSNTLFLIYPVRMAQSTSADFQFIGRTMLFAVLQMLLLIPCLGIPATFGGLAYVLTGYSLPVFLATSWLVLAAELPLALFALASRFDRFDPSLHMPA
jgi:ABC-2 type transport system permease protein